MQARRLSISFRKIHQAVATITHVDIFIGSLTGTSERFASSLAEQAAQRGAVVTLQSLEDFNPQCFDDPNGPYHSSSRVNVFVVSTHFAGGPSPNAETFSQWLKLASSRYCSPPTDDPVLQEELSSPNVAPGRRITMSTSGTNPGSEPSSTKSQKPQENANSTAPRALRPRRQSSFSTAIRPILRMNWKSPFANDSVGAIIKAKNSMHGVQYAVFGVGNSMYLTYNAMGKFVDARLQTLGAVRLCPLGLGDVTNDIESSFAKWEAQLLNLLVLQKSGPPTSIAQEVSSTQRQTQPTSKFDSDLPVVKATVEMPSSAVSGAPQSEVRSQERQLTSQHSHSFMADAPIKGVSTSSTSGTAFSVQDLYGRCVRLRFRCQYVANSEESPTGVTLPLLEISNSKPTLALFRSLSTMRRDATHIRHPCISLQAITIINRTISCSGCITNPSASKEVALIRLAIQDPELAFQTGDTFGYYPPNATEIVEAVGSILGLDMHAMVELTFSDEVLASSTPTSSSSRTSSSASSTAGSSTTQSKNRHLPFPSPCTIRAILRDFLELRSISREFVRVASGFVTDPIEHELLENLISIDSSAAFNREFAQATSGMLKLLEMAPSLRIPFEVLVNITPLLRPRLYSIASSHEKNDRAFDILVALGGPNEVHGLSVSNFRRILMNSDIQVPQVDSSAGNRSGINSQTEQVQTPVKAMLRGFVASSRFKTPPDLSSPMIMIANGIGIAPLRALLQHHEIQVEKKGSGDVAMSATNSSRKNLLLFGCSSKASLVFESELHEWEGKGLVELHVAYSCEPGHDRQHVQDLVSDQIDKIAALMSSTSDARIYICGKAGMARAVHQLLAASGAENCTDNWYEKALVSGRYIESIAG